MAEAVWGELSARRTPTRDLGGGGRFASYKAGSHRTELRG